MVNTGSQDQTRGVKESPLVERFLDNLWAERGLSDNSLQSYRHDLLNLQTGLLHGVVLCRTRLVRICWQFLQARCSRAKAPILVTLPFSLSPVLPMAGA